MNHFGSLRIILKLYKQFRIIMNHFGLFKTILTTIQTIQNHHELFWII
jgi:hypothetical protein